MRRRGLRSRHSGRRAPAPPKPLKALRRCCGFCQHHLLLTLTITSVVIGMSLGFALRGRDLSPDTIQLINFPGDIFLQVLKLMILPLIFSSLISALAQLDAKAAGQMGMITVSYYATTTILSTITGIVLVLSIHPGNPTIQSEDGYDAAEHTAVSPLDTFLDVVRNLFPENVIQATFQRVQTTYYEQKPNIKLNHTHHVVKKKIEYAEGMNILGIVMFCSGFGIIISKFGEKARIIIDFFVILEAVIMKLVDVFMWLAPLGIVCLIAGNILELDDLYDTASILMWYVITVIGGLTIHTIFTMPMLYIVLTRKNPLTVVNGMVQALVTAFGTASGVNAMYGGQLAGGQEDYTDGNALYEAVAVVFIAQLNNVTLSISEVITVSDRVRTAVNVLGDAFASSIVAHYMQEELQKADELNEFHQELNNEIHMLKSTGISRKPSLVQLDEHNQLRSRRESTDVVSWKDQAILDRLTQQISLAQVKHL